MTPENPAFGSVFRLEKEGWEGLPDTPNPYHFVAGDGMFLHRKGLVGRGVVRLDRIPNSFKMFGDEVGGFDWTADPIPAKLMGQIVNFFERIYDRQHTEAAVILVMHSQTREWRVFVPTQMLSHGGVNYVFDPEHIKSPWVIVGSIHSHCDFGAGHSSTDTGDAEGFDGVHGTIGHIKRDIPEIVFMASMNKKNFHFGKDSFPALFDFSEVKQHEAPKWWDRYCEDTVNKVKPVGFDLFAKFKKPSVVKPVTTITKVEPKSPLTTGFRPHPQQRPNPNDWTWDAETGSLVRKPFRGSENEISRISKESREFNQRQEWRKQSDHWEDRLDPLFLAVLFDTGLVDEEDIDLAAAFPHDASTEKFWIENITRKVEHGIEFLEAIGKNNRFMMGTPSKLTQDELDLMLLPEGVH